MNDEVKIDWKKYVDKIYCITWTGSHKTREKLWSELKRVDIDINDHELFLNFENITTPLHKELCDNNFFSILIPSSDNKYCYLANVIYAQYYCMKHAQNYGYDRILIIEDDVIFLKDKNAIINILDAYNEASKDDDNSVFVGSILKYDGIDFDKTGWSSKYIFFYYNSDMVCDIKKVNENMTVLGTTAFTIYRKKAYEHTIKIIEEDHTLIQTDNFQHYKKYYNIYYNDTNICMQYNDMFYCVNWFYLYNADIYIDYIKNVEDKYEVLKHFTKLYKEEVLNGTFVLMDAVKQYYIDMFNQINMLLFNNKLNKEEYIL